MEDKYNRYYKILNENKVNFKKIQKNNEHNFNTLNLNFRALKNGLTEDSWQEIGKEVLESRILPVIACNIKILQENVVFKLGMVCNLVERDLVKLLNNLKHREDDLSTSDENKREKIKLEIEDIKRNIERIIKQIESITIKEFKDKDSIGLIDFSEDKFSSSLPEEIRNKKKEFLGNINNPDEYTRDKNYASMKKYPLLFNNKNGKIIEFRDPITKRPLENDPVLYMKVKERVVLTVKLPTNTGMIKEIRRTTAHGGTGFGDIVTSYSDMSGDIENPQYNNYQHDLFPEGLNSHKNYYEWVIVGEKLGDLKLTQTCEYTDYDNKLLKVMCRIYVKVVDKLPEERKGN